MSSVADQQVVDTKPSTTTSTEPTEKSPQRSRSTSPSITPLEREKSQHDEVAEFKPTARLWLAFATLMVLTLMVALDSTIISVALPRIAHDLKGTGIQAFWAGTSFLVTATVFQPSYASFSHIFGRKPMIIFSIVFFFVGVMIGGFSKNFTWLLVGRSLQGVGGGGILALTEIVVTDLVPLRQRGQYFGIISGMWSVGSVLGPVVGGAFAEKTTWRWIFWVNLPFIGIAFVMVPLFLKLNFIPSSMASKLRRVDWFGTVVFVASTTSFLIPVTWGGVMYDWTSWRTLVPLLLGAAGLAGFALYEVYVAKEPTIRLSIFELTTAKIGYALSLLHGMILWCLLYYSPLYFEAVKEYNPMISGVALFPATFTVAPSAVIMGFLITKTGKYQWSVWLGWALTTLGCGLYYLFEVDTPIVKWIFIMLVSGVGLGVLFPSMQFVIQAASSNADLAFAVAMFTFFRNFGNALGVAVGGTVFQNSIRKKLLTLPTWAPRASELAKDVAALVQTIKHMPDGPEKRELQESYAHAFRSIMIVLTALSAVGLFLSFFVKAYDLDRALETEQGFVGEKKGKARAAEEGEAKGITSS